MNNTDIISGANEPNFVAFRASEQDYCIDIMDVREIRSWSPTTSLPGAPGYIKGVINLRGSVVPILDFSACLGLASMEPTERNVIVIVKIEGRTVGLLVDEVSEILSIVDDAIKPTRNMGHENENSLVTDVIVLEERMIRLVDLERMRMFSDSEAM